MPCLLSPEIPYCIMSVELLSVLRVLSQYAAISQYRRTTGIYLSALTSFAV